MSGSNSIFRQFFLPAVYARWEWIAMRVLIAQAIFTSTAHNAFRFDVASQPQPVGIAQFIDLTWMADPTIRAWLGPLSIVAIVVYMLGRFSTIAIAFLLFVSVGYGTLMNSQGAIHHTGQILSLVLLAQLLALLRPYLSRDPIVREKSDFSRHAETQRLVRYSLHAIAATYVASGLSKLIKSGGDWVSNVPNIALQFEKNRQMAYYNYHEAPESEPGLAMAQWVGDNPSLASAMFGIGLLLELFAFVALAGRAWALAWGVGMFFMHMMVSQLMGLGFAYNKQLLVIFAINLPFWLLLGWKAMQARRTTT